MARTKKRLKITIMGHRDSLSYLIVSCLGYVTGTSSKRIDREGLGESRTGIRQNTVLLKGPLRSEDGGPEVKQKRQSTSDSRREKFLAVVGLSTTSKGGVCRRV